jgi:hypothetical protein
MLFSPEDGDSMYVCMYSTYKMIQHYNQDDQHRHLHHYRNIKSHSVVYIKRITERKKDGMLDLTVKIKHKYKLC